MGYDSRPEQARQFENNYGDMLTNYSDKYGSFAAGCQANSPFPEEENEPVSAISALNQRLGTVMRDDKKEGIQSSTLNYIFSEPHRAHAWCEGVRESHISQYKGAKDVLSELAYTVEDFTAGGGFRLFQQTPVRDDDEFRVWPGLEYVAARVERQSGNQIRILEYTTDAGVEGNVEWDGVSDIPLAVLKESETPVTSKWIAGGIKMNQQLRMSMSTSEKIMYWVDKSAMRGMQKIVDELLAKTSTGVTETKDVGIAGTLSVDAIVGIGSAFETKEYKITTLFGRTAKIDDYNAIDRSGLSQNAGMSTTAGMVVGGDMYGDAGVMRMNYDVTTGQIANRSGNTGIDVDEFLGIDVMKTGEVYIVSGTDTMQEEDIIRSRSWDLSWTLKYATTLMTEAGRSRIRFE